MTAPTASMSQQTHTLIRKYCAGFGALFSNIYINKVDNSGTIVKTIKVPVIFGPKEKYLTRETQNTDLTGKTQVAMTLPRMSFQFVNIYYDADRMLNIANKKVECNGTTGTMSYRNQAVPYTIDFQLSIMGKELTDVTQIFEQIAPRFKPFINLVFNNLTSIDSKVEVPLTLLGVNPNDNYTGAMIDTQHIIWTLQFTMKVWLYGPVHTAGTINSVQINIDDPDTSTTDATINVGINPTPPPNTPYCETITVNIHEFE